MVWIKARHTIDGYIATAQFAACTIVNFIKRRTSSMILTSMYAWWYVIKKLVFFVF